MKSRTTFPVKLQISYGQDLDIRALVSIEYDEAEYDILGASLLVGPPGALVAHECPKWLFDFIKSNDYILGEAAAHANPSQPDPSRGHDNTDWSGDRPGMSDQ